MIYFDRLLRLADFLDTLPEGRFFYGKWVGTDWGGKQDLSCGTTACALGWAASMPEFQALGLCLRKSWGPLGIVTLESVLQDKEGRVFGDSWDHAVGASEHVFGISGKETEWLFTPSDFGTSESDPMWGEDNRPVESATAGVVAEHIRRFVYKHADYRSVD